MKKNNALLFITLVYPAISLSTVFLERDSQPAINVSQMCIGYLALEDTIIESKKFKRQVDYLVSHPLVQGIILDINSGGGLATASWEIFETLKRVNMLKPIVSYVDETSASGAYLAACASSKIVANPMATIGSIGVVRTIEKLHPTEFKYNGMKGTVTIHRFKKGKFKQLGSSYDPMTDDDMAQLEQELDFAYQKFCTDVALQRHISIEQVQAQESLTFTGLQALDLGLIDKTGSFDDALELLKQELIHRGHTLPTTLNLKESLIVAE